MVAASLDNLFEQLRAFRRPPVESWHPETTVPFDLVITADGRWVHEGDPIRRRNLVKLFATVLVRREGDFYLVTPRVRYRIQVEDTPFLAVEVTWREDEDGRRYWFRTDVDEVVPLDGEHPLDARVNPVDGRPSPTVIIRDDLAARLLRPVYYELAEHAVEESDGSGVFGIRSGDQFFALS